MSADTDVVQRTIEVLESPAPEARKGESTYVVQMFEPRNVDGEGHSWRDIATVTVPRNTPRKIVFRKALEQSGLTPGDESIRLRALDAASAAEQPAEPFQPDAEWRIG